MDTAVREQLEKGVSFSLPTRLEYQVASLLVEIVPCCEMVRFGKNGSDATSAAIRLSRAYTGRERVAACGYHGWHDWYIGTTTKNLGVPEAISGLTSTFQYNDAASLERVLEKYPGEFAAIILEPMNMVFPHDNFLTSVKELAHKHGAVLIFDEICTGARLAPGGAQEVLGVTPDLCVMGKGLANGYPLSALMGRSDIMSLCETIFFSGTFGGEALSLAAAKEVLLMVKSGAVTEHMQKIGEAVLDGARDITRRHRVDKIISFSGHPCWSFINIHAKDINTMMEIKTLFLQEMFNRGLLILGSHNISYAHNQSDIDALLSAYDEVMPILCGGK